MSKTTLKVFTRFEIKRVFIIPSFFEGLSSTNITSLDIAIAALPNLEYLLTKNHIHL